MINLMSQNLAAKPLLTASYSNSILIWCILFIIRLKLIIFNLTFKWKRRKNLKQLFLGALKLLEYSLRSMNGSQRLAKVALGLFLKLNEEVIIVYLFGKS